MVASLAVSASPAGADPGPYVALGDSYTAAPLVPLYTGIPLGCLRSNHGYPSLVAAELGIGALTDASCSGAKTRHTTIAQAVALGTNPPQFDSLRADARIITVGIGANDVDLIGIMLTCVNRGLLAPTRSACRSAYAQRDGSDANAAKIAETAPRIAAMLRGIRARLPQARIVLVGYPSVTPRTGGGCYPLVPMSPDDLRYVDEVIVRLNAMLAAQAAKGSAEFADTYADSAGHDVCAPTRLRWFEGLVPTALAFPLHPNALGMRGMARSVLRVLRSPRPVRLTRQQIPQHVSATRGARPTPAARASAARLRSARAQ